MTDFTFAHREEGFDDHIEHSIRGYSHLLGDVVNLSRYFVEDGTNVVDIGCSTGKLTNLIMDTNTHAPNANYVGVEIATGFTKDLEKREKDIKSKYPDCSLEFKKEYDIRDYEFDNCSLITSLFTLQFMPLRDRRRLLQDISMGMCSGGALLLSEKTISDTSRIQDMMTFNYYDYKQKHFSTDDILEKEKTLRSMMKPNTWKELFNLVETAGGFDHIQPFWQNHMFIGILAIKHGT